MILNPNAKINLGLNVVRKREDGYHDLETVFYPIPLCDRLCIETLDGGGREYELTQSGRAIEGASEDNLVIRALRLLKDEGFHIPSVRVDLEKNIPSGAGLGGGSSDASFMLKGLRDMLALPIDDARLEEYAARLGADCAVFVRNRPVFAEGIGNVFTPISLDLGGYSLLVIKPDVFISTGKAFANIRPRKPQTSLLEIIKKPVSEWRGLMANDFEESIFPSFPEIRMLKERLYEEGAIYASMSGSGSSLFGIFSRERDCRESFRDCFYEWMKL